MTYRGRVQNGQIVLERGARLDEGAEVVVTPIERRAREPGTVDAILGSDAQWHGSDEELCRLLAELKQSKLEELQRQLAQPEPQL